MINFTLQKKIKFRIAWNKILFVVLILANAVCAFSGCGSPRNHQVSAEGFGVGTTLVAREFTEYDLSIKSIWSNGPYPSIRKASSMLVFIYDGQGRLVNLPDGLTLGFWAVMPSMGHGMEDAGYFDNLANGIYENSNLVFQMPGDWQIEISILDQDYNELDKVIWQEFF